MNKESFIDRLAKRANITKTLAGTIVEHIFDGENGIIAGEISRGRAVKFQGFGSFQTRILAAGTSRNPKTGESMQVPARRMPHFVWRSTIRDLVKSRSPVFPPSATDAATDDDTGDE